MDCHCVNLSKICASKHFKNKKSGTLLFFLKKGKVPVNRFHVILLEENKSMHLLCGWAKLESYQIVKKAKL
jgi:hypothetical protein